MYNLVMPGEFSEWITKKYIDWRGNSIGQDRSISKFAEMLGVRQNVLSAWMQKNGKAPRSKKNISALIRYFGFEVYDALDLPRPSESDVLSQLPPELSEPLIAALEEIRASGLNTGKEIASTEDFEKIKAILSKHGVKFNVTFN